MRLRIVHGEALVVPPEPEHHAHGQLRHRQGVRVLDDLAHGPCAERGQALLELVIGVHEHPPGGWIDKVDEEAVALRSRTQCPEVVRERHGLAGSRLRWSHPGAQVGHRASSERGSAGVRELRGQSVQGARLQQLGRGQALGARARSGLLVPAGHEEQGQRQQREDAQVGGTHRRRVS
jgi:hypothetical protein